MMNRQKRKQANITREQSTSMMTREMPNPEEYMLDIHTRKTFGNRKVLDAVNKQRILDEANILAQHGPVRVLVKDGKPVVELVPIEN